ncbi:UDP-3-O-[3-hydroxymyristoyl] glucosamine N-acyltransferase [Candidatus Moduliflexus flocculans]|uniref:UDP-3-O-acylglucosamine N-acyltransferase n=1 Tax=Candidatus Moduliflexus flocculans TaxID=1499966 RepID=A0A0S6VW51_9BACT|nr:UDP-3-O-[3-hydroxymyristoyl] glucosamine N-acyltransferase [Candidatus Moduliflexus flocculans]
MEKQLRELAEYVQGEVVGDGQVVISSVAGIEEAMAGAITFLSNPKYRDKLPLTRASAVIVAQDVDAPGLNLLKVANPYFAFARIMKLFEQKFHPPIGIHPTAVIGDGAAIGEGCRIGAHVTIGHHVNIGARTIIHPGVVLGDYVTVGADTLIYPNVSVLQEAQIGDRVILHSGTVIGSDGFGFAPMNGEYAKIPQIGTVVIEDDVEIGANVTIDRAALGQTHIKKGVKIDNLVQIGHNVVIGEHSIIVAQVGISGSTKLGRHVTLAGQVGVVGHIEIGDDVTVAAQSGIPKSVPEKSVVAGSPAVDQTLWKKSQIALHKLPDALKTIRALERRIRALEEQLSALPADESAS